MVWHLPAADRAFVYWIRLLYLPAPSVYADDPQGSRRRGTRRWLQLSPDLLVDHPAPIDTGIDRVRSLRVHRELERLARAADLPGHQQQVHDRDRTRQPGSAG